MANLQILGMTQSNFVWVVRMACAEKGVPYDLVPARPHSPEVDAIHPFGRIPAMRHGDLELCESKAIATYIDRNFDGPKLIPDEPAAAAKVEQWVSLINTQFDPVMMRGYVLGYFFPETPDGSPNREKIDGVLPAMRQQVELLDRTIAKTGYLAGTDFSLADIVVMPLLYYLRKFPEGSEAIRNNKNLDVYYERLSERPCFKATIPPPPPGR